MRQVSFLKSRHNGRRSGSVIVRNHNYTWTHKNTSVNGAHILNTFSKKSKNDIIETMRLPNRKPGKYTFPTFDPVMTQQQFDVMVAKLERIKKVTRPQAIRETQQYGENGDFSENAEYQIAKGRLRGLNRAIDDLEKQIGQAIIIDTPKDTSVIQTGHTVVISVNGNESSFKILGSSEANPTAGIISYQSPLGAALIGHRVGDTISLNIGDKTTSYKIISVTL